MEESLMMLNAEYLTKSGGYRAVYRGSAISSTDWTDLSSDDFYDVYTGSALAASLTFRSIQIVNRGSSSMFLKYRARVGAGDSTAYTEGVIQIEGGAEWSDDIILNAGPIQTIAFKKGATGDQVLMFVGFDKGN